MTKTFRKPVQWQIKKLTSHPRQHELFPDLPEPELQRLADDMQKNGQQHPIEILPDGTIVAGHQRVRAAQLLGWTSITCIVRDDLAEAGPAAVEAYLVTDNLHRRQLSPLGRARCVKALLEIEQGGELNWKGMDKLKSTIGEQLGMTTRNVNRYLLVLRAPEAVQEAFDRGELTLQAAGRVALLSAIAQMAVADRIAEGEPVKDVVNDALASGGDDANVGQSFRRLCGALQRELPHLTGRVQAIRQGAITHHLELLRESQLLMSRLTDRLNKQRQA